jgi:hypothetical protein
MLKYNTKSRNKAIPFMAAAISITFASSIYFYKNLDSCITHKLELHDHMENDRLLY